MCVFLNSGVYSGPVFHQVLATITNVISSKGVKRRFACAASSLLSYRRDENRQPKDTRAGGDGAEITCRYNIILTGDTGKVVHLARCHSRP